MQLATPKIDEPIESAPTYRVSVSQGHASVKRIRQYHRLHTLHRRPTEVRPVTAVSSTYRAPILHNNRSIPIYCTFSSLRAPLAGAPRTDWPRTVVNSDTVINAYQRDKL